MLLWIGFIICTSAIVFSGIRLSRYGDMIAEKTGLGRAWIGIILMASVTSLPELVTGIGSVTYAGAPDIAVGDALGSCVFNMLIIALLDAGYRIIPISAKAHQGNVLSAAFGMLLLCIVAAGLFFGKSISPLGWIGPYSLILVVLYFLAMRLVFFYEKRQIAALMKEKAVELRYEGVPAKTAIIRYSLNAGVVITAAAFLPGIGKGIAEATGLGQTFAGNIFIAVSTSLPEIVVSFTALKMDAIDLAVGNLFGSNLFNIFILAVDDVFFMDGPVLSYVSQSHLVSALSAIAMTAVAVIGLTYRAEKKALFIAWDSIGIVVLYTVNLMLLYLVR